VYSEVVEVHVSAELEAKLTHVAAQQGRDTGELVQDVLTRYLEEEARFLEAVDRGIAAADRSEFIDEDEMDAYVDKMLLS
jgi:predicted transcriptional regulator